MVVEVRKMFFVVGVVKNVREDTEGEFHGKFEGMSKVTVKVAAEVGEIVAEEIELFGLGDLSLLEWSSERRRNRDRGKVSAFASRVVDVVAIGCKTNREKKEDDVGGNDIVLRVA
jgi:hypothetical protein